MISSLTSRFSDFCRGWMVGPLAKETGRERPLFGGKEHEFGLGILSKGKLKR